MASASAAAESSSEMLQAIDIEELEVTETDAELLRELLEEWEKEELEKDRILKEIENELNANSDDDDKHDDGLEQTQELDVDGFDYYWPEMVEVMRPSYPPVNETMAWYVDPEKFGTSSEFDCNIDCSQLYSGVFLHEEETTYDCLWQY